VRDDDETFGADLVAVVEGVEFEEEEPVEGVGEAA
jgi:hypothetical protein